MCNKTKEQSARQTQRNHMGCILMLVAIGSAIAYCIGACA